MRIELPAHGWTPRHYQWDVWEYMFKGGTDEKHAELIWHRRAGKDEICLHLAAVEMNHKPATYWHMLPQANQVRKAIWEAINPHTGRRRIDDAFPKEIFDKRESDMLIRHKGNGATWQCMGSDNYEAAIGSPPRGITYSEWALANPSVRGYLRPIIAENRGWQLFIGTPRGKNHAYQTYKAALSNPKHFAQLLTVADTGVLTGTQLKSELEEYINTYGDAYGKALFAQEYFCSFEAAIIGSLFGQEMHRVDVDKRITDVPHDPRYKVHVGTDLGISDDLSIWWYQVIDNQIHVLEHLSSSGKDPDWFCSQLMGRDVYIEFLQSGLRVSMGNHISGLEHRLEYNYGSIGLPHDGAARSFAAKGKTVEEQLAKVFGWKKVLVVPKISKQDQIQCGRKAINAAVFDFKCETDQGIDGLREYQRKWDDEKKMFLQHPLHNWASHRADAWMNLSVAWDHELLPREEKQVKYEGMLLTFDQMMKLNRKRRLSD